jgi:hypothetical protein
MSYGTGRPAILKDDESIWQCRFLLQHPLAVEDDMRLVSMVELMAIRERITNHLSPFAYGPVDERTFEILRSASAEFKHWYQTWDESFSQKYEDAGTSFDQSQRVLTHLPSQVSTAKASRYSSCMQNCIIAPLLYEV